MQASYTKARSLQSAWDVTLGDALQTSDGNGIEAVFWHGSTGIPGVMVYAPAVFDDNKKKLNGDSCRSKGASRVDPLTGLGVSLNATDEGTGSLVSVAVDWNAVVSNPSIYNPDEDTVQFCLFFYLANDAGEEANFSELEVRLTSQVDNSVQFLGVDTAAKDPDTRSYSKQVGVTASICNDSGVPQHQGEYIALCLSTEESSLSIANIDFFVFESGEVVQNAFIGGIPDSDLTEIIACTASPCSFSFRTLLIAGFYLDGPRTVSGYGNCTLQRTRRLGQDAITSQLLEETDFTFEFVLGPGAKRSKDQSWKTQVSAGVLVAAFVVLGVFSLARRRKTRLNALEVETEPLSTATSASF